MNKKILSVFLVLSVLLTVVFSAGAQDTAAETVKLTILGTNDIHSYTADTPDKVAEGETAKTGSIGYAKIAAYKKQVAQNGPVLLFDSGDATHGQVIATLLEGESIIWLMNEAGYDAMTPGNHDFNYGYQKLIDFNYMADFPILSGNLVYADSQMSVLPEYTIFDVDGIKVGVFGISTPETLYKSSPVNTEGLQFIDPYEAGKYYADFLRPHVDLVVCLSHLGLDAGSEFTSEGLANAVPGIDVIIDAHSHTELPEGKLVGNTLIAQAGEHGRFIDQVEIELAAGQASTDRMTVVSKSAKLITYGDLLNLEPDPDVLEINTEIEKQSNEISSVVIGKTTVDLDGERETNRKQETNLGDLIAQAMLLETGADVAITNGGGIRASIPAGDVTLGQVITTFPCGNYVVTIEATGQDLIDAMENGLSDDPELKGAFPQIAGMRVVFDPSKPAGSRVVEITVDGKPVDPAATYVVATNNFMAIGGDEYTMFADDKLLGEYSAFDEILADYLTTYGTEGLEVDGRISTVQ